MKINELRKNETYYYSREPVKVLKIYETFNMVKIMYLNDKAESIVDACAISREPSKEITISLGLFVNNH